MDFFGGRVGRDSHTEVPKGGQPVTEHSEVAYSALPLALLSA